MTDRVYLQRRKNGYYYIRVIDDDGKERKVSTGVKSKQAALKMYRKEIQRDRPAVTTKTALSEFTKDVLRYVEATYASKTVEMYRLSLRELLRVTGDIPVGQITARHVDAFKAQRLSEVKPTSVNIQLRTLRAAFALGKRWDVVEENPFRGVRLASVQQGPPVYFTKAEFSTLLTVIRDDWLRDVVVFAVSTGMRMGEILNLRWSQVDIGRRMVHLGGNGEFKTKTGHGRPVPLNETSLSILKRLQGGEGEYVFLKRGHRITKDNLTHRFKKAVRDAGLSDALHFHSLRHTFASWLVQDGVSLYQVGRLLGHTTARTTEVYAHLQPETMHDVVDRLTMSRE